MAQMNYLQREKLRQSKLSHLGTYVLNRIFILNREKHRTLQPNSYFLIVLQWAEGEAK